jgi:hypothetical protein
MNISEMSFPNIFPKSNFCGATVSKISASVSIERYASAAARAGSVSSVAVVSVAVSGVVSVAVSVYSICHASLTLSVQRLLSISIIAALSSFISVLVILFIFDFSVSKNVFTLFHSLCSPVVLVSSTASSFLSFSSSRAVFNGTSLKTRSRVSGHVQCSQVAIILSYPPERTPLFTPLQRKLLDGEE